MQLVVTILETSFDAALDAIRGIALDHDAVELRAEDLGTIDLAALRASTPKTIVLTRRGRTMDETTIRAAIAAGIDLIDVELDASLDREMLHRYADRIVLSHHDYDGMPDVGPLANEMCGFGTSHVKIAVTPATLDDNLRLLTLLDPIRDRQRLTVIGMGDQGLYSRVLAPFRGSELAFVAPDEAHAAAPGQITLARALAIYGSDRSHLHAASVFAIAGYPARHSVSPTVHNPLFREKRADAAYTIASFPTFGEIAKAFEAGELRGLSITAPFKEEAFAFASRCGATIGENAVGCRAVNTLVQRRDGLVVADNTDVDGFSAILHEVCGRDRKSAAVVGAGGTARAALVALRRAGIHSTVFNRTPARGERLASEFGVRFEALDQLSSYDGEIVIDTLPPSAAIEIELRPGGTYIQAAYGTSATEERAARLAVAGVQVFNGLDLLHAQAIRQNEIFIEAIT